MKKTYKLEWGHFWTAIVEITESEESKAAIKAMVEFWTGWEQLLEDNEGDYTVAFLKHLGSELAHMSFDMSFSQICNAFIEGREGWVKMNGEKGILLIKCASQKIEPFEIAVSEKI